MVEVVEQLLSRIEHEIRACFDHLSLIRSHLFSVHSLIFSPSSPATPQGTGGGEESGEGGGGRGGGVGGDRAGALQPHFPTLFQLQQGLRGSISETQREIERVFDDFVLTLEG